MLCLRQLSIHPQSNTAAFYRPSQILLRRTFIATPLRKMPNPLKAEDVKSETDPTIAQSWDTETPKKQQIEEFYKTVDGMKIGLLTTIRDGLGPVSRSMAVAKVCPDFTVRSGFELTFI